MKNWYPEKVAVSPDGTPSTYQFMSSVFNIDQHFEYAEFGIWQAATATNVCNLFPNSSLHLFDFYENIENSKKVLSKFSNKITYYPNTQKYNDSYNWSLAKLLKVQNTKALFDYCFLDGAHTFAIDALNFFLCDKLLKIGGFIDFDDYSWTLRGSSLDPLNTPEISDQYTNEQIDTKQVAMIIDLLVKTDDKFIEIVKNKIYQKIK